MKNYWEKFIAVFKSQKGFYWPLIVLFCIINAIVLLNAIIHDPLIGYDSNGHIDYVISLSQGHLPNRETNHEFFSPPLTYVIPALLKMSGFTIRDSIRAALFVNFFASLAITYLVLKIIKRSAPENPEIQTLALLTLGMIPAYYKTLSFLRGEPLVTLFTLLVVYFSIKILISRDFKPINIILLGLFLGMSILSRQWAFFIFPALILFASLIAYYNKEIRSSIFKTLFISISIAFILGAWFYIGLIVKYGTVTAFNRGPIGMTFLSPTFFTGTGDGNLFSDPVRPSMPDQFWPIMHSEIWGDYWGYFSIFAYRPQTNLFLTGREIEDIAPNANNQNLITNKFTFNKYLGKVNLISLFPSFIFLIGLLYGFVPVIKLFFHQTDTNQATEALLAMIIFFTLAGYTWFMIEYPAPGKGDTTKASYILNLFPLLSLLIASFFQRFSKFKHSKWVWWAFIFSFAIIMLYDSRAMISHVNHFPW